MKSIIISPTYNESKNISTLVRTVFDRNPDIHLLIVDDSSPDGTGQIVRDLQKHHPNLHLETRKVKDGLGIAYLFGLEENLGNLLTLPTTIVINLAILVVGTRLGIITNNKNKIIGLNNQIKSSILLKLLIFPSIIFLVCKLINFDLNQASATVIQSGTPSAISTILMAEAYKYNQGTDAQIVFTTTLISFITLPILTLLINTFY